MSIHTRYIPSQFSIIVVHDYKREDLLLKGFEVRRQFVRQPGSGRYRSFADAGIRIVMLLYPDDAALERCSEGCFVAGLCPLDRTLASPAQQIIGQSPQLVVVHH